MDAFRCFRSFPLSFLVIAWVITSSVFAALADATPCRPTPERWITDLMLQHLSPEDQLVRAPAVAATVAECPAATEAFYSALFTWEFLQHMRSDPGLSAVPVGPGEITVFPGRGTGYVLGEPAGGGIAGTEYVPDALVWTSPLLLDLNGDGNPSVEGGHWEPHIGMDLSGHLVPFDIDGDGFMEITEWVGPQDGLLVAPENPSKVQQGMSRLQWVGPLSGRDLLGTSEGFADGFAKLAFRSDQNGDGMIAGQERDSLYVWRDLDGDATIQEGELDSLSTLAISQLQLPGPGLCVGAFTQNRQIGSMWDWWPSFLRVRKDAGEELPVPPPEQIILQPEPLPDLSDTGIPMPVDEIAWVHRSDLEEAGFDFQSGRLLALSPGGSWLILQDAVADPLEIDAGRARRLWILPLPLVPGGTVTPVLIPIPVVRTFQFVFESEDAALVIGDNGSSIIRVDLVTHDRTLLWNSPWGQPGFRSGNYAFAHEGDVTLSGCFYNADRYSQHEALATIHDNEIPPTLEAAADLDSIRARVRLHGPIAEEYLVSPRAMFFVVGPPAADAMLVSNLDGVVSILETGVAPFGIAASGNRVIFFAKKADEVELAVYEVPSGRRYRLGTGDFCYPYLVNHGTTAFATSIDWGEPSMTLWKASLADSSQLEPCLEPVLTTHGIGAIRVSEDGLTLAYLGPDGLKAGATVPSDVAGSVRTPRSLLRVSPTPFAPPGTLRLDLSAEATVRLDIYALDGRVVATVFRGHLSAGPHKIPWNGRDEQGGPMPSGLYFCRLEAGGVRQSARMLLIR